MSSLLAGPCVLLGLLCVSPCLTDDDLTMLARRAEGLRKPAPTPVQLAPRVDHDQVEGEGAA